MNTGVVWYRDSSHFRRLEAMKGETAQGCKERPIGSRGRLGTSIVLWWLAEARSSAAAIGEIDAVSYGGTACVSCANCGRYGKGTVQN